MILRNSWYNGIMASKNKRERVVVQTSAISIGANILLAGFKAMVGLLSNSIAIVTDAVNNLSDALSSIITIVGTKLAGKTPDKKHPYGYGRIEYVASLTVSAIVLYAGITAAIESVKKIFEPEDVTYDTLTLVVLVAGIIVKFILGLYVKKKGRDVKSDSLVASGVDAFNDAILSISVLASAVIYLIWQVNIEAYVGVVVSVFIIKAGVGLIRDAVNSVLGTRAESELTRGIRREILKDKRIKGAFDLVLNDYGPDKYMGSVHIEIPASLTAAEIDKMSRDITRRVAEKYGVLLHTVGVYSINTTDKHITEAHEKVRQIVFSHDGVLQMHGFYLEEDEKQSGRGKRRGVLSFDIILDFKIKDREAVYRQIFDEVAREFPGWKIAITLDVDASD